MREGGADHFDGDGALIEDGVVTCPLHFWRFRLADGTWADNPKIKVVANISGHQTVEGGFAAAQAISDYVAYRDIFHAGEPSTEPPAPES